MPIRQTQCHLYVYSDVSIPSTSDPNHRPTNRPPTQSKEDGEQQSPSLAFTLIGIALDTAPPTRIGPQRQRGTRYLLSEFFFYS